MADYTQFIGGNTTMMIRDTGLRVEFWIKTGSSTYNFDQQWSFFANGADSGIRKFRMVSGGNWQHFGSVDVYTDQTVRFTIYGSGIGFPTSDFYQYIPRTRVPDPPGIWQADPLSSTHIRVSISDGWNGGAGIVERQLGYGGNPSNVEYYWDITSGTTDIGTFVKGSRIFFWARTRNAVGWSGWSNRAEATTWREPDAPSPVTFLQVSQKTVRTQFVDRGDGGRPVLERQLGFGKNSVSPTDFQTVTGTDDVINLDPGKLYYFWARSRNFIGWGPWSERTQVLLIAGARVLVGSEWKRAVPYIKVAGVWRVARPWIRNAGTWKETSV
jgi:hypothetical protein